MKHTSLSTKLNAIRRSFQRAPKLLCAVLGLSPALAIPSLSAEAQDPSLSSFPTNPPPAVLEQKQDPSWSFNASAYLYILPDSREYVQPTFSADHAGLHLEARYNYEDLDTGSAWVGYNLAGGNNISWELTPMLGAVFGDTSGVAPGFKGSVSWWKLELYSEGEYVWDTGDSSDSFFYNWSELSLWPLDWLRIGMAGQRTRVYDSDREVQRGVLVGVAYKTLNFTGYAFNPDQSKPIFVFALGMDF